MKQEDQRREERDRRRAAVRDLAARLAHKGKNPLGSIRLFAESLEDNHLDPSWRRTFEEVVLSEVETLSRLLRDLEAYARPSEGTWTETDLAGLLGSAVRSLSRGIARAGVRVQGPDPAPAVPAVCQAENLKSAFRCLLENALEAMERSVRPVLTLEVGLAGDDARVTVTDTGEGVPEELREKIFEPFFSTRPSQPGMGLALARKILDEHRGSIEAGPGPAGGACFRVSLPRRPPRPAAGEK